MTNSEAIANQVCLRYAASGLQFKRLDNETCAILLVIDRNRVPWLEWCDVSDVVVVASVYAYSLDGYPGMVLHFDDNDSSRWYLVEGNYAALLDMLNVAEGSDTPRAAFRMIGDYIAERAA